MSLSFSASNEQIFRSIVAGDQSLIEGIFENFNPLIRSRIGYYLALYEDYGLEYIDLEVVGKSALLSALKLYRGDNIPFAAFAAVVIQNAFRNYIKQITRPSSLLTRRGMSLDGYFHESNNTLLISDSITDSAVIDFGLYSPSPIGYFEDSIPFVCENNELDIILWKLQGFSYQEIREKFSIPKRKLDDLIAVIKAKSGGSE